MNTSKENVILKTGLRKTVTLIIISVLCSLLLALGYLDSPHFRDVLIACFGAYAAANSFEHFTVGKTNPPVEQK
jgi:hypothetical protein